jgi:hypothetical protein
MNIRRVEVEIIAGQIRLRIYSGYATTALPMACEVDPATALVLASKLEAAVHTVCPEGLPESQPKANPKPINPSQYD